jgi:hypothetical protein
MFPTSIIIGIFILLTTVTAKEVVVLEGRITYGEYIKTCESNNLKPIRIGKENIQSAGSALVNEKLETAWIGSHDYWGVLEDGPYVHLRNIEGKFIPDGLRYLGDENLQLLENVTLRPMCYYELDGEEGNVALVSQTNTKVGSEKIEIKGHPPKAIPIKNEQKGPKYLAQFIEIVDKWSLKTPYERKLPSSSSSDGGNSGNDSD